MITSTQRYRLHWIREEKGGLLRGHDEAPEVTLDTLAINETLAGRILGATPPASPEPPALFLPYVSRRDRFKWPERQMNLEATETLDGRIVVGGDAEAQMAGLLVASPDPLVFTDRRRWDGPVDWDTVAVPLLSAHRLAAPGYRPPGPFVLTFELSLASGAKRVWRDVPHRREAAFLYQFRGLSSSLQRALRAWIPYQYFHQPQRFAKPVKAAQYLVYAALPVYPSRRKTQLTFHVLEPQRVIHSLRRLGKPLAELMRRATRRARPLGLELEPYAPNRVPAVLKSIHRMPRFFGALLSLEAFVVEELILFAAHCHDLREDPRATRVLVDPALELRHRLNCRLARSYAGESYENLLPLIVLAATAGLGSRGAQTPAPAISCRATVTECDTGKETVLESRISFATNDGGPALIRV